MARLARPRRALEALVAQARHLELRFTPPTILVIPHFSTAAPAIGVWREQQAVLATLVMQDPRVIPVRPAARVIRDLEPMAVIRATPVILAGRGPWAVRATPAPRALRVPQEPRATPHPSCPSTSQVARGATLALRVQRATQVLPALRVQRATPGTLVMQATLATMARAAVVALEAQAALRAILATLVTPAVAVAAVVVQGVKLEV